MSIERRVFSIWLSEDGSMPDLIKKCIESQQKMCSDFGYDYHLVTLDNCPKDEKYIQECLESPHKNKKWCKLSDWLRMRYLIEGGGIYLDGDVECLPGKNFDDMLGHEMFVGVEKLFPSMGGSAWIGSAVVGAQKDHWFVKEWKKEVGENFHGDDSFCFESSMQILTKNYYLAHAKFPDKMPIYPAEVFYPYCHFDSSSNITDSTITVHHFAKSWV